MKLITKNFQKGFTLIELLVVIAIIGILASVVLASLNTARDSGSDAAVKANLNNIRPQAELAYAADSCYGDGDGSGGCVASAASGVCAQTANTAFGNSTIYNAIVAASNASGGLNACSHGANGSNYAVVVQLTNKANGWCIDSSGKSKQVTFAANPPSQAQVTAEVSGGLCVE